jgi:hypothetical protein
VIKLAARGGEGISYLFGDDMAKPTSQTQSTRPLGVFSAVTALLGGAYNTQVMQPTHWYILPLDAWQSAEHFINDSRVQAKVAANRPDTAPKSPEREAHFG